MAGLNEMITNYMANASPANNSIGQEIQNRIILNDVISHLFKTSPPTLRGNAPVYKSSKWINEQKAMAQQAAEAGLPVMTANPQDSTARMQLIDAIARSEGAGYIIPHFTGMPNEPTGDRASSMDIEGLVSSLEQQEKDAIKAKDIKSLDRISREKAYWQNEMSQGMTAEEWKNQTGEDSPIYPK